MNLRFEDEGRIRTYLLGELTDEKAEQQLEERLLADDAFVEQVQMVEDELIEDYARGALGPRERERFEAHFLKTPRRRRKLMIVEGMREAATDAAAPRARAGRASWLNSLFLPRWKLAAAALLLVAAGLGVWRAFFYSSQVDRGLVALHEAYREQRPLETRITGFSYAPFSETRGGEPQKVDGRARDHAAALLLGAATDSPTPDALQAVGRLYMAQKEFDEALRELEAALKARPDDARLHADVGAALFEKGKLERRDDPSGKSEATLAKSLEHLNRALELDAAMPEARFNRALLYTALKLPRQAGEDWEKYLAQDPASPWAEEARRRLRQIREQRDKVSQRGDALYREFTSAYEAEDQERVWRVFSKSHLRTGNYLVSKLIDGYLDSAAGGRKDEAAHLLQALSYLGQLSEQKAGDSFTADLAQFYRAAPPSRHKLLAQARGQMNSAYDSYNQSRNDQAIVLFGRAKSLFEQLGDYPEAMLADYARGHCYFQQPDTQRSLSIFAGLVAQSGQKKYRWLQAISSIGLANVRTRLTQYSEAIDDGWDSYKLSAATADENGALRSLSTLASLYRNVGRYHRSLQLAQQAFDLAARITADGSQVIGLYATSAWDLTALGHYASALEYEKEAVRLGEEMKNPLALSRYYVQTGIIYAKLKKFDEAQRHIQRGLEVGQSVKPEKIGDEMASYAALYLARLYRESGQFAEALAALQQVIQFCRQKNEAWLLHEARKEQIRTHMAQKEVALVREELPLVLASYEEQREKISEEGNRNSFFDKEQDVYDLAIDFAHFSLGDLRQSFEYSETSRSRSLLDASLAGWQMRERAETPELRFAGTARPAGLDEIRRQMPADAQLLQYAVLEDRLVIWYVSGDLFESRAVEISAKELSEKVERFLNLVSKPPDGDARQLGAAASELFGILVQPVADLLDGEKLLCVVPDKILHFLPYGALISTATRRFMAEEFLIIYAPSSNIFIRNTELARRKRGLKSEQLLSVGNPLFSREKFPALDDLPWAAAEAKEITAFYASHTLLTGPEATKDAVVGLMRQADVLHLATHYLPAPTSPMLSELPLARGVERAGRPRAPDGVLRAGDIYYLSPLKARLVVLSACQTGVEGFFKGEGAIGLSRPFQAAGVPLVVASFWPVNSEATADLMITFHRLRKLGGVRTAAALREAQVKMLTGQDSKYRHPYYWAPFAAIGGYTDY